MDRSIGGDLLPCLSSFRKQVFSGVGSSIAGRGIPAARVLADSYAGGNICSVARCRNQMADMAQVVEAALVQALIVQAPAAVQNGADEMVAQGREAAGGMSAELLPRWRACHPSSMP